MKYLFLFIYAVPSLCLADLAGCGEYTARAIVRAHKTGIVIVVNEKTKSEYVIEMPRLEGGKLAAYLNKPSTIKLELLKKFDGTKGFTDKITSIELRIPDPLNPQDTGLTLNKKMECIKGS